jgi:hypothetical protein
MAELPSDGQRCFAMCRSRSRFPATCPTSWSVRSRTSPSNRRVSRRPVSQVRRTLSIACLARRTRGHLVRHGSELVRRLAGGAEPLNQALRSRRVRRRGLGVPPRVPTTEPCDVRSADQKTQPPQRSARGRFRLRYAARCASTAFGQRGRGRRRATIGRLPYLERLAATRSTAGLRSLSPLAASGLSFQPAEHPPVSRALGLSTKRSRSRVPPDANALFRHPQGSNGDCRAYPLELQSFQVQHTFCITGTYPHLADRWVDPICLQWL